MNAEELRKKAWERDDLGKHNEALALLDQAIKIDPKFVRAQCNKGAILDSIGKKDEALVQQDAALAIDPKSVMALNNKGDLLDNIGRSAEAILYFDQAIKIDPKDVDLQLNKGNALKHLERRDEAIVCYDQAIHLDPKDERLQYNKGNALKELERYGDAIVCYDQAIHLDPKNALAQLNKGVALKNLRRYDEAIFCYDKLIHLNLRNADAQHNKGTLLNEIGRKEDALACFDKVIQLEPKHGDAQYSKGTVLYTLKRYNDAIIQFDKSIHLNPKNANAQCNKGAALKNLGRNDEAIVCFDQAIQLNPNNPLYLCNRAAVLMNLGKDDESLQDFLKLEEMMKQTKAGQNNISKANISYINLTLSKDKQALIERISSVASVSLEDLRNDKNQSQIDALKVQKAQIIQLSVEALNTGSATNETPQEKATIDVLMGLLNEMMNNQNRLMAENEEIRKVQAAQGQKLDELDQTAARRSEVEYAILTNANNMKYKKQMDDIEGDPLFYSQFQAFVFTLNEAYVTSISVASGQLQLNTSNAVASIGSSLVSLLPLVGDQASSAIDALWKFQKTSEMNRRAKQVTKLAPGVTELGSVADAVARCMILDILGEDEIKRISQIKEQNLKWWIKLKKIAKEANAKINGERQEGVVAKTANEHASKLLTALVTSKDFFKKYPEATTAEAQVNMICEVAKTVFTKKEEEKDNTEGEKGKEEKGSGFSFWICKSPTKKKVHADLPDEAEEKKEN